MKKKHLWAVIPIAAVILLSGCAGFSKTVSVGEKVTKAVAVIVPTQGNTVTGTVSFLQEGRGVRIVADLKGLPPGKHGIHIHEFGDITAADGSSAGSHLNPRNQPHGGPDDELRHMGDLGNLDADRSGGAKYSRVDTTISLNGPHAVVGRAIVIKAAVDDFKTQPGGAAGARIGWGVIGIGGLSSE